MAEAKSTGTLDAKMVANFSQEFNSDSKNILAMNVVTTNPLLDVARSREAHIAVDQMYSVKISTEGKMTNQRSSGRCWLFAATNVMRIALIREKNLDTSFEFSQSYLFFWDKFEKANFFLENVLKTMDEDVSGRLFSYLLQSPVQDGGQWDMVVNVVKKHGLVPKSVFPETEQCILSRRMNWLVTNKLREYAYNLREMHSANASDADLRAKKDEYLNEIYRILAIHLGEPPKTFTWKYYDKEKKFHRETGLTPQTFAASVPFDVSAHVSLVNDPRNPYYQLYTVDYLGNVVGGERDHVLYINLPIEKLKEYAIKTLEDDKPVWFGCDVGKYFYRKNQLMDTRGFDYELLVGTDFGLDKAQRLHYGASLMTHAMVFTGVDIDEDKTIHKWRVENSWGDKDGDKGYATMTDRWFDQYMYQVVIDRNILEQQIVDVLEQTPTVLPAWDPMGSLAN